MRRLAEATGLLLGAMLLSGCSLISSSPTPSTMSSDSGGLVDPLDARYPPLADVTVSSCKGSGGTWSAVGSVHNPTKSTYGYTVSIAILDASGSNIAGAQGTPAAPLKPGAKATWKATTSGVPATAASCTVESVYRN